MPISKQKLKELAQRVPGGKLSNGLTPAASDLINKLVDKLHALLFKKGSSAELAQVESRLRQAASSSRLISDIVNQGLQEEKAPYSIPLVTIKKMIREHAGDIKVPENTLRVMSDFLNLLLISFMDNAAQKISGGVAVLDAKDIKLSLADSNNLNHTLAALIEKARGLRKSSSKKRKSSKRKSSKRKSSSRRCSKGKRRVSGFKRSDGKRVKAYCRKSTSRRTRK